MAPPKSIAWNHFDKRGNSLAKCKYCAKIINTSNNTTNMMQHLKLKHALEISKSEKNCDKIIFIEEGASTSSAASISKESSGKELASKMCSGVKFQRSRQPSLLDVMSNVTDYKEGGEKHSKLTLSIAKMVVIDNLPFRFVEGVGLKKFVKNNFPLYKIPTRNTIKSHIDNLFEEENTKFKEFIKDCNHICLTTEYGQILK
ncbi:PREDICTED: uncharacterized protein LOC108358988 isoform X2 [Rhagoletis zephyria]|uniref:uncharacterized protein LOC108358988 isoform X2 n=1 Tax=Rhagoletis zephyria TaxID=28612 RepID=UPI00081130EE|nr:PREDICTED: uncharacterized protein LOC108358988 isoform X2 [Rhagoletis zephyria]